MERIEDFVVDHWLFFWVRDGTGKKRTTSCSYDKPSARRRKNIDKNKRRWMIQQLEIFLMSCLYRIHRWTIGQDDEQTVRK